MVKSASQIGRIIDALAAGLKAKGIKIDRLILFGSHANGNAHPYSDIDIAVISPTFNTINLLKRQELLGEVIFPLQEPIEAIGYSTKEFRSRGRLSFLSEVVATGRTVFKGAS